MDDLIKAIASNDLVKFKQIFAESMKGHVGTILENRKLEIARSIMVEGEEPEDDEGDEDEDEDDEKSTKKGKDKE